MCEVKEIKEIHEISFGMNHYLKNCLGLIVGPENFFVFKIKVSRRPDQHFMVPQKVN